MKKATVLKLVKSIEFLVIFLFVIIGGFSNFVNWQWGIALLVVYLILNIFGFANRSVVKKENK